MNFVVTIEYTDGTEFKIKCIHFGDLSGVLAYTLDTDADARKVKRITICPVLA